jgi:hypothetical protein
MSKKPTKMDCSFVRSNLFSYQEKLLSVEKYKKFEDHLDSCNECSLVVSEFQSVTSLIEEKKATEPNPYVSTRIIQRLESKIDAAKNKRNPIIQRILQPVSLSFMLLIAIVVGFSIVKQKATTYSESIIHQQDIQAMKSSLHIPEFIDEDNTFFDNQK